MLRRSHRLVTFAVRHRPTRWTAILGTEPRIGWHRSFPTSNTLHAAVIGSASDVFRVMQQGQDLPGHPFRKRTPARPLGLPRPSTIRPVVGFYATDRITEKRGVKACRA